MDIVTRGWLLVGQDHSPEQGKWLGWRVHADPPEDIHLYRPVTIIEGYYPDPRRTVSIESLAPDPS